MIEMQFDSRAQWLSTSILKHYKLQIYNGITRAVHITHSNMVGSVQLSTTLICIDN